MSDFKVVVTGSESTQKGLTAREAAIRRSTIKSLKLSSEVVLGRATENVSGKILNVQSGTLWRRLSYHILADQALSRIGSPTVYAPVHEYGAVIQHPGGTAYYFRKNSDLAVFLSNAKAAGHNFPRTRPHAIPIPARPWLRPALKDSQADIEAIFRKGAAEAIGQTPQVAP